MIEKAFEELKSDLPQLPHPVCDFAFRIKTIWKPYWALTNETPFWDNVQSKGYEWAYWEAKIEKPTDMQVLLFGLWKFLEDADNISMCTLFDHSWGDPDGDPESGSYYVSCNRCGYSIGGYMT